MKEPKEKAESLDGKIAAAKEAAKVFAVEDSDLKSIKDPMEALATLEKATAEAFKAIAEAKECYDKAIAEVKTEWKGALGDAWKELTKLKKVVGLMEKDCTKHVADAKGKIKKIMAVKLQDITNAIRALVQQRDITIETLFGEIAA